MTDFSAKRRSAWLGGRAAIYDRKAFLIILVSVGQRDGILLVKFFRRRVQAAPLPHWENSERVANTRTEEAFIMSGNKQVGSGAYRTAVIASEKASGDATTGEQVGVQTAD